MTEQSRKQMSKADQYVCLFVYVSEKNASIAKISDRRKLQPHSNEQIFCAGAKTVRCIRPVKKGPCLHMILCGIYSFESVL